MLFSQVNIDLGSSKTRAADKTMSKSSLVSIC